MIKPDGIALEKTIMDMVLKISEIDRYMHCIPVTISNVERLYSEHKGSYFYDRLIDFFKCKDVKVYVLRPKPGYRYRKSFVDDFRVLVGHTDPSQAEPGSIRALSFDSVELSIKEKRCVHNLVHSSNTYKDAEREIEIFFGKTFRFHKIHNHPAMERELGVNEDHVIIDTEIFDAIFLNWEKIFPLLVKNGFITDEKHGKEFRFVSVTTKELIKGLEELDSSGFGVRLVTPLGAPGKKKRDYIVVVE
jgi:nucleoside diphosphate kinase